MAAEATSPSPLWPSLVALSVATGYLIALLAVEEQSLIIGLLSLAVVVVLGANYLGVFDGVNRSFTDNENTFSLFTVFAALVVATFFYDDHFVLLLCITVILYIVATLGLNIQFGYSGILNFAGASFF